jgi:uncharacterized protein
MIRTMDAKRLRAEVAEHPFPLLFATVSGAHLYGFASADSDWDVRGVHLLPLSSVAGLDAGDDTVKLSHVRDGAEVDLVTHDARKFFALLLRNNGYVLEQLYSPLVVHSTPEHDELRAIARGCVTRACVRHYLGFAANQWRLFEKEEPRRVKPLLYVYRVLLTGIHMMRTGEVNASLPECNERMRLPYVAGLVARKTAGAEHEALADADVGFHRGEYVRLSALLAEASEESSLPPEPTVRRELHDLLLRVRLGGRVAAGV